MRRAARLAIAIHPLPGWRLAVRDVHSALGGDPGDDAFVFGYRAIEDLVRAVTHRTGELRAMDWRRLHTHLATSQDTFLRRVEPLKSARDCVVHGDVSDPALEHARAHRESVLEISRRIVADAIINTELPLRSEYLRPLPPQV
jgi:hypothetical protein